MPKPSIGRMALALPLLFGVAPALGGYQGASENVAMVEMRTQLANRKSGIGNPPPTAGASETLSQPPTPSRGILSVNACGC
jgi:hypothetical protein